MKPHQEARQGLESDQAEDEPGILVPSGREQRASMEQLSVQVASPLWHSIRALRCLRQQPASWKFCPFALPKVGIACLAWLFGHAICHPEVALFHTFRSKPLWLNQCLSGNLQLFPRAAVCFAETCFFGVRVVQGRNKQCLV